MLTIKEKYLEIFLWLVAIHSFLVGAGLILVPYSFMDYIGYNSCDEPFFRIQGGVFHIAMAVGYSLAAFNPHRFVCLIIFSIIVKFIATMFLLVYYFLVNPLAIILLSGIADFLMGLIILYLYKNSLEKFASRINE